MIVTKDSSTETVRPGTGTAGRSLYLACGIAASAVYVATDLLAGHLYPGYSFRDQAVSELFAIGAPTSALVTRLFTLWSVLLLPFAAGVWRSLPDKTRVHRAIPWMIVANAVNTLILWNLFPMHMRSAEQTFSDIMHLVFAANPFIPATIVLAAIAFPKRFRLYSIATLILLFAPAVMSFSYAPALAAHQPTPWMGLAERVSQYGHQLWQALLALLLMRRAAPPRRMADSGTTLDQAQADPRG